MNLGVRTGMFRLAERTVNDLLNSAFLKKIGTGHRTQVTNGAFLSWASDFSSGYPKTIVPTGL